MLKYGLHLKGLDLGRIQLIDAGSPRQWKRPSATDKAISFTCRAPYLNSWKKTASAKWLRPSAMLFRPSHSAV